MLKVGDLVRRAANCNYIADRHPIGMVVNIKNTRLGSPDSTGDDSLFSVLWSDGRQFRLWGKELMVVSESR